jgi:F-type H+-transporting ATPase subunit b
MDEILEQLKGLFIGSIPTIIFFLLLVVAYGLLVRRPLDAILAERRKRTTGAIEQARGAISTAEAETQIFEDKLRAARTELFNARDERLKRLAAERERALGQAREVTQTKVAAARLQMEQSAAVGRQQIDNISGELSAQILRAVLPAGVSGIEVAQ